jgi:hypothetical protein
MADELPYQQAAQVRQLLAERETAEAYGQTTRVEAADKQLAELGYKRPGQAEKAADAAEDRAAAALAEGDEEQARGKAPEGRTARPKQTTEGGKTEAGKKP